MNLELVEQIVVLLSEYPVSEIAVKADGVSVHVSRPPGMTAPAPGVQGEMAATAVQSGTDGAAEEIAEQTRVVSAPMVGIFYHTEPPLPFGAELHTGDVIGTIESMKLMNDVNAEEGGRVTDVLVEDGAPVEYGQALFRLTVA